MWKNRNCSTFSNTSVFSEETNPQTIVALAENARNSPHERRGGAGGLGCFRYQQYWFLEQALEGASTGPDPSTAGGGVSWGVHRGNTHGRIAPSEDN